MINFHRKEKINCSVFLIPKDLLEKSKEIARPIQYLPLSLHQNTLGDQGKDRLKYDGSNACAFLTTSIMHKVVVRNKVCLLTFCNQFFLSCHATAILQM